MFFLKNWIGSKLEECHVETKLQTFLVVWKSSCCHGSLQRFGWPSEVNNKTQFDAACVAAAETNLVSQVVSQITKKNSTPISRILGENAEVVNHLFEKPSRHAFFGRGSKQRHHFPKDNFLRWRRQKCFGIAAWLQNSGNRGCF